MTAKRVELKRSAEATGFHEAYFKGPITFGARRNALVLHAADLDRPFLTYNAELLDMLNPQLERALEERRAQSSIREQVEMDSQTPARGKPAGDSGRGARARVERSDPAASNHR